MELARHGHGEIVASAGDQRHFNAAACGFGDRRAVGVGNLPAAIQQRAVNVQRNESHSHCAIVAEVRRREPG